MKKESAVSVGCILVELVPSTQLLEIYRCFYEVVRRSACVGVFTDRRKESSDGKDPIKY